MISLDAGEAAWVVGGAEGRRAAEEGGQEQRARPPDAGEEEGRRGLGPLRRPAAANQRRPQNRGLGSAIFGRALSRLHQNEILQENMRLTAFFKLYKICILLHRCNLKILAKNRFEKSAIFVKIQQHFCKCCKICKNLPNFKKHGERLRLKL